MVQALHGLQRPVAGQRMAMHTCCIEERSSVCWHHDPTTKISDFMEIYSSSRKSHKPSEMDTLEDAHASEPPAQQVSRDQTAGEDTTTRKRGGCALQRPLSGPPGVQACPGSIIGHKGHIIALALL